MKTPFDQFIDFLNNWRMVLVGIMLSLLGWMWSFNDRRISKIEEKLDMKVSNADHAEHVNKDTHDHDRQWQVIGEMNKKMDKGFERTNTQLITILQAIKIRNGSE